jgi:hypothetical protein
MVERALKLALPMVLALAVVAIGFGSGASAQSTDARVRITHASPDAPAVDIWVNGSPAVTGLAFGQSTDLLPLPAGTCDVAVTPAGSTDPEADAVISTSLTLEAGAAYEVVANGLLANISASVYPLDLSPLAEGNTRIEVIHASPDAPAVNILANGNPIIEDLQFPESSGFLEVPSGSYDIQVAVAESGAIALDLPGTALEAGQVYQVIAVGLVADGSLTVLPLAAPADTATGGTTSSGDTATSGGTGTTTGTTAVPATGVGSTVASSSTSLLSMAALAFGLLLAGGLVRNQAPARARVR